MSIEEAAAIVSSERATQAARALERHAMRDRHDGTWFIIDGNGRILTYGLDYEWTCDGRSSVEGWLESERTAA